MNPSRLEYNLDEEKGGRSKVTCIASQGQASGLQRLYHPLRGGEMKEHVR
jgi:hypothetical protein